MGPIRNSGSPALLVRWDRFGAEPPRKSLENKGDTSRGQAQITKSAEEPEKSADFEHLESATPGRDEGVGAAGALNERTRRAAFDAWSRSL